MYPGIRLQLVRETLKYTRRAEAHAAAAIAAARRSGVDSTDIQAVGEQLGFDPSDLQALLERHDWRG